ncbi:MAG TPA: thioredoxin fold domain-containing protein [Mucilaginibacter sp.]|jgi:thioredoxin-related protein
MKKLLLFLSVALIVGSTNAQTKQDITHIPPFKILKGDSTYFTPADLKKDKPVMIIYFSPDCSHCQHLVYDMKPKMKQFGDTQIVMVTFIDYSMLKMIKTFSRDFDLAKYHNIIIGTEGRSYVVQKYYQVRTTPYIAVYDRKGKLVTAYEKAPTMNELIATIKKAEG